MTPVRRHVGSLAGWILGWLAATLACLAIFAQPTTTPLDDDEVYWIGSAYYFHLAFVRGDWTHADWTLLPARENPPVAKYLLGLGLTAANQPVTSIDVLGTFYLYFADVPGAWGIGAEYAKRAAVVGRVSPSLSKDARERGQLPFDVARVVPARRVVVGAAIVTSLLLLILGWQIGGPLTGLLASQLLLLHPAVIHAYNHAHSDLIALLFSAAAAVALWQFACCATAEAGPRRRALFGSAAGTGVLLGLACGAKMNSLVIAGLAVVTVVSAAVAAGRHEPTRGPQTALAGVVMFAVAVTAFAGINPAILLDVPAGLQAAVQEHRLAERIQANILPGHLTSLTAKASAVAQLTAFSSYALASLSLLALGLLFSSRRSLRFAAAWFLIALLCVTIWIPFSRGRYALPVILPATILVAAIVGTLTNQSIARLRRRESSVVPR